MCRASTIGRCVPRSAGLRGRWLSAVRSIATLPPVVVKESITHIRNDRGGRLRVEWMGSDVSR